MAGGYDSPPVDRFDELLMTIDQLRRDVAEVGRPTGSQVAQNLETLRGIVEGLVEQTAVNVSGDVTAGGNITAGGTGTFTAGVTSAGVFALDVSLLPGTRRTNWTNINGQIGYAPSTITKKVNPRNYEGKASAFLACQPVVFEYMGQVAIRDDPTNPYYDPSYVVPLEFGHIAEWLIVQGLGEFVFFDEDGVTPAGINYAEFAAVGFIVVGRDHEERIVKLERASP